jgi:hypothetical protein
MRPVFYVIVVGMNCGRYAGLMLAVGCALVGSACFQSSTVLTVKADGSGTIDQRVVFTQSAIAQLRQLATLSGGGDPQTFDPVSEEQAREGAAVLGPGVTYLSSTPINNSDGVGRDIKYAFTDINQLRVDQAPVPPGGGTITSRDDERVAFKLTRQPNGNALLTITVPQMPALGAGDNAGQSFTAPSPEQIALIRPMVAGAHVSIAIEPAGRLVRTNSLYVTGQRVVLLDVDLDSALSDDALLRKLQTAKTPDDAKTVLKNVPGLIMNLEPELTIEFQ